MQIDMNRFRAVFLEEAAEHLDRLEAGLLRLEASPADEELLNAIFRSAHSIKGAAGTFGFDSLAGFTHGVEAVLDRLREGVLAVSPEIVRVLLRATDVLRSLLVSAASGDEDPPETSEVSRELSGFLAQRGTGRETRAAGGSTEPGPASRNAAIEYAITFHPAPETFRQGMDPLFLLRDLSEIGTILEIRPDLERLPPLEGLDPESCYLGWHVRLRSEAAMEAIKDVFLFLDDACQLTISKAAGQSESEGEPRAGGEPAGQPTWAGQERRQGERRASGAPPESTSIRVATEKVDKLIDLVGELVISQSMLMQALRQVSEERVQDVLVAAVDVERNTRELQERVMGIRMVPIASVFNRFPRLVHDLAAGMGKQVALEVSGGETELDKAVVERLGDPLTHLVRNAVDHGLEPGQDRIAAGKPEAGHLWLSASHEGGSVVVEVRDDGRGLNTARIREKAIGLGWMRPEEDLADEQVHAFIFQPALSTAETVTGVSGRGVGMDVVKRNVQSLGGSVSVSTRSGLGTTFRIRLPLTLAILDGLLLGVAGRVYIMPLVSIIESLRPRPGDVRRVFGRGELLTVRGQTLPLLRLHSIFDLPGAVTEPTDALVVVVEVDGGRVGILVDELLGQSQAVIKSLEANYRKVDGITAATILGDGQVALILDAPGLVRLAYRAESPYMERRRAEATSA